MTSRAANRWLITTDITGKPRAIEIRLYTDLNHLRGAATRHYAWSGEQGTTKDMLAVCHGFTRGNVNASGDWDEDLTVAIIRLTRTHLTPLIISHEVAHAAQHIYGLDYEDHRPVVDHMHAGNEDFAQLLGELFAAVWAIFATRVTEAPDE